MSALPRKKIAPSQQAQAQGPSTAIRHEEHNASYLFATNILYYKQGKNKQENFLSVCKW
jgi:hypothetical protein